MRSRGVADQLDARPAFHLHPANLPVLRLWGPLQSQWRHGMAGPTGLDWQGVRAHPAVVCTPRRLRERHLAGIAAMEQAWLAEHARRAAEQRELPH